jgi:hypothetical protein
VELGFLHRLEVIANGSLRYVHVRRERGHAGPLEFAQRRYHREARDRGWYRQASAFRRPAGLNSCFRRMSAVPDGVGTNGRIPAVDGFCRC